jgi:hypothetical protein
MRGLNSPRVRKQPSDQPISVESVAREEKPVSATLDDAHYERLGSGQKGQCQLHHFCTGFGLSFVETA